MPNLFDPIALGPYTLRNRIFMSPMTRGRATPEGVPTDIMVEYYRQRASAGLIITEATAISPQGTGWLGAPGIHTDAHEQAWRPVTEAVHAAGGRIFLQLWHMGRVSHPDFLGGALPVGPSAIAAAGQSHTAQGNKDYVTPRALAAAELPGIAADYAAAARRAIGAGFDGVELHGANGYLLDQFIRDGANQRDDAYGGSIERRWRFPLEVAQAVAQAVGSERTGFRVSPTGGYNGMSDRDPVATFSYGAERLAALGLAYLHVMEPLPGHMMAVPGAPIVHPELRKAFSGGPSYSSPAAPKAFSGGPSSSSPAAPKAFSGGPLLLNGGYDRAKGDEALATGQADAIAFASLFLANPDLPRRLQEGAPFNPPDFATFYTPGPKGYIDYPRLGQ
jgi:N-ethylmaleimide reductase